MLDGGDMEMRQGLAVALLEVMVEAGEMPADMLQNIGVAKSHFEEE